MATRNITQDKTLEVPENDTWEAQGKEDDQKEINTADLE